MKYNDTIEPRKSLRRNILSAIKKRECYRARAYLVASIFAISGSIFGIWKSVKYILYGLQQSSFYSYLSLIFSDTDVVFVYWKELSMSIIEALPILSIIASLLSVAVLFITIRLLVNNVRSKLLFNY